MKKLAVLFPGQGPQYPGMGKILYERSKEVQDLYDAASEILSFDLAYSSFNAEFDELMDTRYAQPALVVASYASYHYFSLNFGKQLAPSFLAGHSLGEITALLAANVLSFEDAIRITNKRGELMHRMSSSHGGTMAAIKEMDVRQVEKICKEVTNDSEHVSIAAFNTATQSVITGHERVIDKVGDMCVELGAIYIPLNISVGSHCPIMEDIVEEFEEFVSGFQINRPQHFVYSCYTGLPYQSAKQVPKWISSQLINPVLWKDILNHMHTNDAGIYLETGPGSTLGKLIDNGKVVQLEKQTADEINPELTSEIDQLSTPITKCLALAVTIPNEQNRPDDYKKFVTEYMNVKEIQHQIEQEGRLPNEEEIMKALEMLETAFHAKRTETSKRKDIRKELFNSFPSLHLQ